MLIGLRLSLDPWYELGKELSCRDNGTGKYEAKKGADPCGPNGKLQERLFISGNNAANIKDEQ